MPPPPDTLPNYHFLLIVPNLGAEWFFDAARAYWERFRPIVVSDLELIRLIPAAYTIAITMIARRDTAAQWGVWATQFVPNALFDAVIYDLFEDTKAALTNRAALNQPFGVPLLPTPTPAIPVSPSPGSLLDSGPTPVPTRAPGGFITQTPTPTPTPEGPQQPLTPTPGAIISN